jgi:hypothetical protein
LGGNNHLSMETQTQAGRTMRQRVVAVLLVLAVTALFLDRFGDSIFAEQPVALRFLYYTNDAFRTRIALMEVSNRTDTPYEWNLHSHAKGVNHLVAVTTLVETNGEFRHVSPYSGGPLFGHETRQFGTDDFRVGERFWVDIKHYPKTADELRREKLSGWLWSHGLHRAARYVRLGQQINGPVLPPDSPVWKAVEK